MAKEIIETRTIKGSEMIMESQVSSIKIKEEDIEEIEDKMVDPMMKDLDGKENQIIIIKDPKKPEQENLLY